MMSPSELRRVAHGSEAYEALIEDIGAGRALPGRRLVLLEGGTGAGRTATARHLAAQLGHPLYRIDLSSVVSKYIGETEKNLAEILSRAEAMDVVLLFDEADALFGKRTEVRDAHDRYANQEVSLLLQRIEAFAGLVILSTNMRIPLDPGSTSRTVIAVEFPDPDEDEPALLRYGRRLLERLRILKPR
ncbi:MAG TPA: ATP-binding protein [Gemmatimonadota bacterium]|nr:ATP-binding protein [Gemmatimonadota bacterium]